MKAKKQRRGGIQYTAKRTARTFQVAREAHDGVYGKEAQAYVDQYIQLRAQLFKLKEQGLKVKIVLPDFPRRPLLIIEK